MARAEFIAVPADRHHDEALTAADSQVRDELRRTDSKAIGLLGLFGATLAAVLASGPGLFAVVMLTVAAGPITVAVLMLLLTLRPNISYGPGYGFPRWACFRGDPASLLADLTGPDVPTRRAEQLAVMAAAVTAKYWHIRVAVNALFAGLVLLLATALTA